MAFELKVLQIVIMAGQVQISLVTPQQKVPLRYQLWVIPMLPLLYKG
jgi:hypothetical protein